MRPREVRERYPFELQLHPIENWFYQLGPEHEALPRFFHVLFYKPHGVGDFEIYDPVVDGPEKLVGGMSVRRPTDRSTHVSLCFPDVVCFSLSFRLSFSGRSTPSLQYD